MRIAGLFALVSAVALASTPPPAHAEQPHAVAALKASTIAPAYALTASPSYSLLQVVTAADTATRVQAAEPVDEGHSPLFWIAWAATAGVITYGIVRWRKAKEANEPIRPRGSATGSGDGRDSNYDRPGETSANLRR